MEYQTIFDAAVSGYKAWTFPFMGIAIMAGGILISYLRSMKNLEDGINPLIKGFKFFFFGFGTLWTILIFNATYSEYLLIRRAIDNNNLKIVEGVVTEFHPYTTRLEQEGFCIKNTCFKYSEYDITNGFNLTVAKGSPLRDGLPVRVSYIEATHAGSVENLIVKLEVGK